MLRLKKPLQHYIDKYGTAFYGLNKMYLLMEKQHNRGQDGAGLANIKIDVPPGKRYISRIRSVDSRPIQDVFSRIMPRFEGLDKSQLSDASFLQRERAFTGELFLAHLRYGTYGKNEVENCHPFLRQNNWRTRNLVVAGNFKTAIDFGDGEKLAMTIPWGDVSTAFHSTGIPNIEVYIPGSPRLVKNARRANKLRWLLRLSPVQTLLKKRIEKTVRGPDAATRDKMPTFVWGEVRDDSGHQLVARVRTANGYSLTVSGSLAVIAHLNENKPEGGAYTPSRLVGWQLVERLPGSGAIAVSET